MRYTIKRFFCGRDLAEKNDQTVSGEFYEDTTMKAKFLNMRRLIIAAFAFVMFGSVICASISGPANATNEETTQTQANSTISVTFQYEIDDPSIIPVCQAYLGSSQIKYTWGEPIQIEGPATALYENKGGVFSFEISGVGQPAYSLIYYTPIGYDIDTITPGDLPEEITSDITYVVSYKKYSGTYQVDIQVLDIMSSTPTPVADYKLNFCDSNFNIRLTKTTDSTGNCSFKDLTPELAEGYILGEGDGWIDSFITVHSQQYNASHLYSTQGRVASKDYANINFSSNDANHNNFEWWFSLYTLSDHTLIEQQLQLRKKSITYYYNVMPIFGNGRIEEDGTIIIETAYMSSVILEHKFIPFHKDGYLFDHWNIGVGDGEVKEYKAGDTFTMQESDTINAEVFYAQVTPPGPEPDPDPDVPGGGGTVTPTGNEIASSLATSDDMLITIIAISLLIAAGFVAHLYTRKRWH